MNPALSALLATLGVRLLTGLVVAFALFVTAIQNIYGFPAAMALFVAVMGGGMFALFYALYSRR